MLDRRGFGVAGLSAVLVAATRTSASAQERSKKVTLDPHAAHEPMYAKCAKACADCQLECDACGAHCAMLVASGEEKHLLTMKTCADCATMCTAAARIVASAGPFSGIACRSCAEACAACASACEQFPDDKHMQQCAKECRECEKACQEMLKHLGTDHAHEHDDQQDAGQ